LDESAAQSLMDEANGDLRIALVMFEAGVDHEAAEKALAESNFVVAAAVAQYSARK